MHASADIRIRIQVRQILIQNLEPVSGDKCPSGHFPYYLGAAENLNMNVVK